MKCKLLLLGCLLSLCFLSCTETNPTNTQITNTNTQFIPKGLYGRVLLTNGQAAPWAKLTALKIQNISLNKNSNKSLLMPLFTDSVFSDSNGYFSFDSLPSGLFNICVEYNNNEYALYIPSVTYEGNKTKKRLENATLQKPGRIAGSVKTEELTHGGIDCYIAGTSYGAKTTSTGDFEISGIPEGKYVVTFMKSGYLSKESSEIVVNSNQQSTIPTIQLELDPSISPPSPVNLSAHYDTLNGVVNLIWNRVKVSDMDGYILFKNDSSSSNPIRVNVEILRDTVASDTVFTNLLDERNLTLLYRIKAQDKGANPSINYSEPVKVSAVSPTLVRSFISFQKQGTINDTASVNDSVQIIVMINNQTRNNETLKWFYDQDTTPMKIKTLNFKSGFDTLRVFSSSPILKKVRISVTDAAMTTWVDSTRIVYIKDIPTVNAGKDDSSAVNVKYVFNGTVSQKFGSIFKYKWDYNGDGIWDDSSNSSSVGSFTYKSEGVYKAIFSVLDDDANQVFDTVNIKITNMPPYIKNVRQDTIISIKDQIAFYCFASDTDGVVKSYSWDFDGNGTFDHTSQTGSVVYTYLTPGTFNAVLKVVDDDNKPSFDSVKIQVLLDPPIVNLGRDTSISINTRFDYKPVITQQFGSIVYYKWDFQGDGIWDDSSSSNQNKYFTFTFEKSYKSILYVRDDDGNIGLDTMVISIVNKAPQIRILNNDTTLSVRDSLQISVNAIDNDGGIKKFSWDINNDGIYDNITLVNSIKYAFNDSGLYKIIIKVEDSFGKASFDTMVVQVIQDAPIITELGIFDSISKNYTPLNLTKTLEIIRENSITFYLNASQQYGYIKLYKYDSNGDDIWDDSIQSNKISIKFSKTGNYSLKFCVVDDDGNQVTKGLNVTVYSQITTDITKDTILKKDFSPYYFIGGITIKKDITLTIEPGCTLKSIRSLVGDNGLFTTGYLKCIGQPSQMIILDSMIIGQSGGKIEIENTKFINNSVFQNHGFTITNISGSGGSATIRNCIFEGGEIYIGSTTSDSYIDKNVFVSFGQIICSSTDTTKVYITNNLFNSVSQLTLRKPTTVYAYAPNAIKIGPLIYGNSPKIIVQYNSFLDTNKIYIYYNGDIQATNNHWNSTNESTIQKMIADKNDGTSFYSYGFLNFKPFLNQPHENTPKL